MHFDIALQRRLGSRQIDIAVTAAGAAVLFGPSGSGKSSILNMIAGLLRPDAGHIRVGGRTLFDSSADIDLPPEERAIGYVFQEGRLFPHLKVRANLLYGVRRSGGRPPLVGLVEACRFLDIDHLLERWPATLSGGEAQRVAIGRALLSAPAALLMDEPLSSLDERRREDVLAAVERVRDELGLPILYVTHDRAEAERLSSTLIAVDGIAGDGR